MKLLMVNGSPWSKGCTYTARCEVGMADFAAFGFPADENFIRHSLKNKGYRSCFRCRECKWLEHYEKCPAYKYRKTERKNVL